jgi:AcrR family transcriptional regulator
MAATRRLLIEEGQDAVTPTRLADVTGLARSTIYRHWPDPAAIVAEAISSLTDLEHYVVTDDPDESLRRYLTELRQALQAPVAALLAAQADRAELNEIVREALRTVCADREVHLARLLGRDGVDESTLAILAGPLLFQRFFAHRPITDQLIEDVLTSARNLDLTTAT